MDAALILFARAPTLGCVKARLGARIGDAEAAAIYAALLSATVKTAEGIDPIQRYLYVESVSALEYFATRVNAQMWTLAVQPEGDLGARMSAALQQVLSRHPRAMLIGADIVNLRARDLIDGFARLARDDALIGPAADGGYWLIGARHNVPDIFSDHAWGTNTVYASTTRQLDKLGLAWSALPVRQDIDTAEDAGRWAAELAALRATAKFDVVQRK